MIKISHVRLSTFITDNVTQLKEYKKSVIIGGLLPDCVPSFVYRRHTIDKTMHIVENELAKLEKCTELNAYFCRHIGIITHYLSDYFTLPHNKIHVGLIDSHAKYEKRLNREFKKYIENIDAVGEIYIKDIGDVIKYIRETHKTYLDSILKNGESTINDCINIVMVNISIIIHLVSQLVTRAVSESPKKYFELAKL